MYTPRLFTLGLMIALTGCNTSPPAPAPAAPSVSPASLQKQKPTLPKWVRQDRYTQANTQPTLEQHQPLYQLINVQIAPALHANVGEALRHVLQRSGYSLCPDSAAVDRLFSRPLPAVHHQLGPISLLDALTIIGGPAWRINIDPINRTVCYTLRSPQPKPLFSTSEIAP
ncbi:PFGI-1 class ICE element type IV pilus protein PilL2 [Pseudomonas veronii]|jgi:type IV pili sensor histidine kinase/response regulator|uniref:PFGI-1 class ICE element type IV pilus protein PilL2 n=1 Tax=Pseudomonas veronii TaxID=76761 RepID=UPI000F82A979|nr:PilL N-terminal domain-containing protein [Pseudomonas veronii]RTY78646.1 pilus assembly protein [Pseudomonas veronii]